ncbi:hypothetical protein [Fulvivirga sedimenti]|uniref:Uncharacterized protein n=1 Tax=Fulvivirga sedimenti TaxID=2879465 RepID=A0A9X1KXD4_9BACT|nr:hypothetical protein [Fulvivirga sedimenti]MCA6074102.1 hypothetical protein [Fulvivirga sedimenti]
MKTLSKKSGKPRTDRVNRPETEGLARISPEQMYYMSEHWLSDMKFYEDELGFLQNLIAKYLMWLIDDKHIEDTRIMVSKLREMDKERDQIESRIKIHFKHIAELIENPFSHDLQSSRDEHAELEIRIAAFMKEFRVMKVKVFRHTEMIMETEKATHLLSRE